MIKPTVGRKLWYYPPNWKPGQQPLSAEVVYVHNDRCINVAIFNVDGSLFFRPESNRNVLLLQDDDLAPSGGDYCAWMQYQKEQAQKEKGA